MSKLDLIFSWLWPWKMLSFGMLHSLMHSSENSVTIYEATRRHIPENNILHDTDVYEQGCCKDQVTRTGLQTGMSLKVLKQIRIFYCSWGTFICFSARPQRKCVQNCTYNMRFDVLIVCWDVTPCTLLRGFSEFLWNLLPPSSGLVKQFFSSSSFAVYGSEH
jgi:hypothetical protein